jgi:hypothetical protein
MKLASEVAQNASKVINVPTMKMLENILAQELGV